MGTNGPLDSSVWLLIVCVKSELVLRSGSYRARHRVLIVREFLVPEESAGEAPATSGECASGWWS
jgi:hypothetical protein